MAKITRSNIAQIRADMEAALKSVATKHGVDFTLGRITFNENEFRSKVTGIARGAAGAPATAAIDPHQLALLNNKSWLFGANFDTNAEYRHPTLGKVRIVGYNNKARAYPVIIAQVGSNKRYKSTVASVKALNVAV